jgi:hypothetical protein
MHRSISSVPCQDYSAWWFTPFLIGRVQWPLEFDMFFQMDKSCMILDVSHAYICLQPYIGSQMTALLFRLFS